MIALVTGATGFIGSHLADSLIQKEFKVRALVRRTSDRRWLKQPGVEILPGNLNDAGSLKPVLHGVDYIFHLAGLIEAPSQEAYDRINVEGTRALLQAVRMAGGSLKKFILVSSQAAGGPSAPGQAVQEDDLPRPVSEYGRSKLVAEKVVLEFAGVFPVVILRPPTIYAPRDSRVLTAFRMMKRGFALAPGSQSKWISFCYVSDLIEALLRAALQATPSGRIYNVAGERPHEWLEFIDAIGKAMGRTYRLYRIPLSMLFLLGLGGELYSRLSGRRTVFTRQRVREFAQHSWVIDGNRIRKELGWQERVSLQEGMRRARTWYEENGWL